MFPGHSSKMGPEVFDTVDYVIMAATTLLTLAIGIYYKFYGLKRDTIEEYFRGSRSLGSGPVAMSLFISFISGAAVQNWSSEFYYYGTQILAICISYLLASILKAYFYLPVFFGLQKLSAYEYLELRFGRKLRVICSLAYTVQQILYNGIMLYAPALALESVAGFDKYLSITIMGVACIVYSTAGGVRAVVIVSVLQAILMYASVISIVTFGAVDMGGLNNIWNIATDGGRHSVNHYGIDPTDRHNWLSLIIGGTILFLTEGVNHTEIQRLLTVKDLKSSQTSVWLLCPLQFIITIGLWMCGLVFYAKYHLCDPLESGKITEYDHLMGFYVVNEMKDIPGLVGLFVAAIFSAAMSTVATGCNCLAAVTIGDYVPYIQARLGYESLSGPLAAKVLTIFYGCLIMAIAFLGHHLGGMVSISMALFLSFGGSTLGVFTLGMFTTVANELGSILGFLSGLSLTFWMAFGGPRPPSRTLPISIQGCQNASSILGTKILDAKLDEEYFYLYRLSYLWTGFCGFLCVFVVGYLLSLVLSCKRPWEKEIKTETTTEGVAMDLPEPGLFMPLLATKVQKRNDKMSRKATTLDELRPLQNPRPLRKSRIWVY